jgi:hypothetical protein
VINFESYKSLRSNEDMRDKTKERVRKFRDKKGELVAVEATPLASKREPVQIKLPHGEAFAAAWSRWRSHRSEIKKPLKPTSELAQLKRLGNTPEGLAVATIDHTIEMGWQGLRAPEPQNKSNNAPTQSNTYGI